MSTHPYANMAAQAGQAEAMLKQLANAKRLMILCSLVQGNKSAGELAEITKLSSSALSQHLTKMLALDLVAREKKGQYMIYRIASMEVQALLSTLHLIYCKHH